VDRQDVVQENEATLSSEGRRCYIPVLALCESEAQKEVEKDEMQGEVNSRLDRLQLPLMLLLLAVSRR
jgi:hypothetical protein